METENHKAGQTIWSWGRQTELVRVRSRMRIFLTCELLGIMGVLWWRNESATMALLILSWAVMVGISAKLSRL